MRILSLILKLKKNIMKMIGVKDTIMGMKRVTDKPYQIWEEMFNYLKKDKR